MRLDRLAIGSRSAARTVPAFALSVVLGACGAVPSQVTSMSNAIATQGPGSQPPPDGGWKLLFDGSRTAGLRGYGQAGFPAAQWRIEGGRLRTVAGPGVDLLTEATYGDFEVEFAWAVSRGGNSGVIYRVEESHEPAWTSGPEYQILDDEAHPDGAEPTTSAGALYGLIAPDEAKRLAPVGDENLGRIVVRDGRVEHWLNDRRVVAYDWDAPDVRSLVDASKFAGSERFMRVDDGHMVFQHHGEEASFGRIRIRRL